jgi:threonine dehydrogenase-like Zn-dependent dehydrogenase
MGPEMSELKGVQGPSILDARGIILKIQLTAICGFDLHLYGG